MNPSPFTILFTQEIYFFVEGEWGRSALLSGGISSFGLNPSSGWGKRDLTFLAKSLHKMVIAKVENKLYLCLHLPKPYAMGRRSLFRLREGLRIP